MKNKILVSAILPVFNEEKYIEKCLDSLINQTYKPTEIIVVDDGSTDLTLDKIEKYDVSLFKQKHKGPTPARNLGASKAKGKILVFPDADIKYDRRYIEILIKPILEGKEIGTFNKEEYVANTDNIWSNCWAINSDLPIDKRSNEIKEKYLPIFRAILKTEFEKVGGYDDIGYGQDGTISKKLNKQSLGVNGAKGYHYNPETLSEVFYSARFIGRGRYFFKPSFNNLLRFSVFHSIRISLKKIKKENAPIRFIVFKIVYDFGMLAGVFLSFGEKSK